MKVVCRTSGGCIYSSLCNTLLKEALRRWSSVGRRKEAIRFAELLAVSHLASVVEDDAAQAHSCYSDHITSV